GVSRKGGIKKRHVIIAQIGQFDVLLANIVVVSRQFGRVRHDLGNHDRSYLRPHIWSAKGLEALGHKMLSPQTGDVTAKGGIRFRGPKLEAMEKSSQVGVGISGENIHLVAQAAEGEAGRNA